MEEKLNGKKEAASQASGNRRRRESFQEFQQANGYPERKDCTGCKVTFE